MSDRAKIRARRVTGNDAQQQREVARAIKNAREMALLPYASRVTTQRGGRDRGDRGDRPMRAEGPPPRPSGLTPPPPPGGLPATEVDELDDTMLDAFDDDDTGADLGLADAGLTDGGFDEGEE
jgi:small subunit ribosomal protein S18